MRVHLTGLFVCILRSWSLGKKSLNQSFYSFWEPHFGPHKRGRKSFPTRTSRNSCLQSASLDRARERVMLCFTVAYLHSFEWTLRWALQLLDRWCCEGLFCPGFWPWLQWACDFRLNLKANLWPHAHHRSGSCGSTKWLASWWDSPPRWGKAGRWRLWWLLHSMSAVTCAAWCAGVSDYQSSPSWLSSQKMLTAFPTKIR